MKVIFFILIALIVQPIAAQGPEQQIAKTERAFEKMVAEKGIRNGFIEFLSPVGVMFMPDAVNGREAWTARSASPAVLTWNPIWIDASANGAIAYSIGNSRYRPNGPNDQQIFYGHYLSIWQKQPSGEYKAALDLGINHGKPAAEPVDWRSPRKAGKAVNPDGVSAGDSAVGFYETAAERGSLKAYKDYLAADVIVMRDGKLPAIGRKEALRLLDDGTRVSFAKRKSFIETPDLAYVHSGYTLTDENGSEAGKGNFVQVWKFSGGKWRIVADVLVPLPAKKS